MYAYKITIYSSILSAILREEAEFTYFSPMEYTRLLAILDFLDFLGVVHGFQAEIGRMDG